MKAFKAKKGKKSREGEERSDSADSGRMEVDSTTTQHNSSLDAVGDSHTPSTTNDKHPANDPTPIPSDHPNNIELQATGHTSNLNPSTITKSEATPTIPLATPITVISSTSNSTCTNSLASLLGRHTTPDPYHSLPALRRNLYSCPSMVKRLSLERRLKEHEGCVNCINFSWGGRLLASGSDDLQVVLWDWASSKVVGKFDSNHVANVFQVREGEGWFCVRGG